MVRFLTPCTLQRTNTAQADHLPSADGAVAGAIVAPPVRPKDSAMNNWNTNISDQTPPVLVTHPGRATLQFSDDYYKRMAIGYTLADPSGHRKQLWAKRVLSEGTTRGGPRSGLLEKCSVYEGPGPGAKRVAVKQAEETLDIATVPDALLRVSPDTGEDVFELRFDGRNNWVEHLGKPKHHGFMTYDGTVAVCQYGGGSWML